MNSMKKIILLLISLQILLHSFAQSISKEIALQTAKNFYYKFYEENEKNQKFTIEELHLFGKAKMYLVNLNDGWILVSSERATTPILASSTKEAFPSLSEMPCGMKWLMEYYENSIRYAKDSISSEVQDSLWLVLNNETQHLRSINDSVVLGRMDSVHWGQSGNNSSKSSCTNFYNMFCPTWYTPKCGHTYVGCTAVAMAQVLWFWRWPHSAIIPDSINQSGDTCCGRNLIKYNWSSIPGDVYNYTPINQAENVAGLLRDCGYATKMEYGASGSGAGFNDAKKTLKNIFHYKEVHHWYKNWYIGNWINRIKENINEGRPVIYAGYRESDGEGHAFVLYGYKGDNFRINWGYRGEGNSGWYTLQTLNPNTINNGPFTAYQEALFDIEPDYPNCTQYTPTTNELNQSIFQIYDESILINNKTIQSNKTGVIYAQNEIRLTGNVNIQSGANVHLAIKDMNCYNTAFLLSDNNETTNRHNIKSIYINPNDNNQNQLLLSHNSDNKHLTIQSQQAIQSIRIYNITGQCVMQTRQTDIDTSNLPTGVYIITANTTTGETMQSKFIQL